MEFALLLLFNVFLGAVLYLIISLKLERSASAFREKKLRREMEDMIHEFNLAAERNISLLESRIRAMRRLLEVAGRIKELDLVVDDDPAPERDRMRNERHAEALKPASGEEGGGSVKKGLRLFTAIRSGIRSMTRNYARTAETEEDREAAAVRAAFVSRGSEHEPCILKEVEGFAGGDGSNAPEVPPLSEDEVRTIIEHARNRYEAVSLLMERGCSAEEISRFCGIPLGEVRLVANLNNRR